MIQGWVKAGCKPFIGSDGCHHKWPYGGQLLTAVGIDVNNQCWVITYAMVEVENKYLWLWFLKYLIKDLEIKNQFEYTFISDKQKGYINALEIVVSNSHSRLCVRHLLSNFKLQFKGKALKDKIWECARATTIQEFGRKMDEMKNLQFVWLAQKPPSQSYKSHLNTIPMWYATKQYLWVFSMLKFNYYSDPHNWDSLGPIPTKYWNTQAEAFDWPIH